jgi:hypothetical protein
MVKEAAAKAAMDLSIGGAMLGGSAPTAQWGEGPIGNQTPSLLQRATSATSFLRSMTRDQRAELKRRLGDAYRLDADLASYHSLSIGARMEMQRERNIEAYLASRRSWWQGVLERGHYNDPLNDI